MPTKRRIHRIAKVIHHRQSDLIIALDGVHDPHNISAVIRTADATGVGRVVWEPDLATNNKLNPEVSLGTERWVDVKKVSCIKDELMEFKKQGYSIAATHMGKKAVDFRTIDWTKPWVVIMGNEQRGCRDETVECADENIFLPMFGFVQSLNISVATAVILYEIQRQRENAGMYNKQASPETVEALYNRWKLEKEYFEVKDLLEKPVGDLPDAEFPHSDGRAKRFIPKKNKAEEEENN